MAKYRKKPIVVEAVKLENNRDSIVNAIEFVYNIGMESSLIGMSATVQQIEQEGGFIIKTLEGDMKVCFGDYIIKGVNEEFYPCKSDIFEKTYVKEIES